jgi:hypothetical protein
VEGAPKFLVSVVVLFQVVELLVMEFLVVVFQVVELLVVEAA